jgi:hypothetical protein
MIKSSGGGFHFISTVDGAFVFFVRNSDYSCLVTTN